MKYSISQILKVTPKEVAFKSNSLSHTEYMRWAISRVMEVIDEDMSHAGPEKWNSYNTIKLKYRQDAIKFWTTIYFN